MFAVLSEQEIAEYEARAAAQPRRRAAQVQCLCGRFAKFVGDRHYYNGTFDCYSYDVDCSRCGVVTIECV